MDSKTKIKLTLKQAQKIRKRIHINSDKLINYLSYQHTKITEKQHSILWFSFCSRLKMDVSEHFEKAFQSLSDIQKAQFYLMNVKIALKISESLQQNQEAQKSSLKIESIYKLSIRSVSVFKKNTDVTIQVMASQKCIKIIQYNICIDLHNYLVRKSKKKFNTLVLQPSHPQSHSSQYINDKIWIYPSQFDQDEILDIITNLWQQAQYENIKKLISTDPVFINSKKFKNNKPKSFIMNANGNEVQLANSNRYERQSYSYTKQGYRQQQRIREKQNQQLKQSKYTTQSITIRNNRNNNTQKIAFYILQAINSFCNFEHFTSSKPGEYYEIDGPKVRKVIQANNLSPHHLQFLYTNLLENSKRKPNLSHIVGVSSINWENRNKSRVYEQVHKIEKENLQVIYQFQAFTLNNCKYFVEKSCKSQAQQKDIKTKQTIYPNFHYCIWRVKQTNNQIEIFVQANIQYGFVDKNYEKTHHYSSLYVGSLFDLIVNKTNIVHNTQPTIQEEQHQIMSLNEEEQAFYTMAGNMFSEQSFDQLMEQNQNDDQLQFQIANYRQSKRQLHFKNNQLTFNIIDLTTHKYLVTPTQKQNKKQLISNQGHWLWRKQWEIRQNGDIVNIDQEKIKAQSGVLKLVLKRLGKNIMSGKSIMNISLPVQIFGDQSHLDRLAKGYLFAPTFLEKATAQTNPVDRMKFVICFGLGFSLNYIRMDKPFNPILGETYQGVVDGCPIYGEQISHHPPISSLYMVGRGYRIYASFEAKVQFGFNTAAGSNDGYNHVQFESDNAVVKLSTPPGELSGLIYGDRKVTVIKKTHCIDEKNKLVCEISWGKNKSSKSELAKYNDFFCGKIVRVKEQVPVSSYTNLKSSQIQEEYGVISGRLTQSLYYNNQLMFDIVNQIPHLIQDYYPCLQSDSRQRKDIIFMRKKDLASSQQAKQQLQNLQRRDRKLRKKQI